MVNNNEPNKITPTKERITIKYGDTPLVLLFLFLIKLLVLYTSKREKQAHTTENKQSLTDKRIKNNRLFSLILADKKSLLINLEEEPLPGEGGV